MKGHSQEILLLGSGSFCFLALLVAFVVTDNRLVASEQRARRAEQIVEAALAADERDCQRSFDSCTYVFAKREWFHGIAVCRDRTSAQPLYYFRHEWVDEDDLSGRAGYAPDVAGVIRAIHKNPQGAR